MIKKKKGSLIVLVFFLTGDTFSVSFVDGIQADILESINCPLAAGTCDVGLLENPGTGHCCSQYL